MSRVLEVKNLTAAFTISKKDYEVLHDLSFNIEKNETLCIVGESGCGKSVTTLAIMDLLPDNGKIVQGEILVEGINITNLSSKERNKYKGGKMGMIFQDPMTALNPLLTIGYQISESILQHHPEVSKKQARELCEEALAKVGISDVKERMKQYPFQLSGGLRQRVMIAMTLVAKPVLLIADEPTTALDVTIQKQVLSLINDLKQEMDAGILFITHDLGVVGEIADRVIVLYSGDMVEEGTVFELFENPLHPYTLGLMNAYPNVENDNFELQPIKGNIPLITQPITGCRFHPRCPFAMEICKQVKPEKTQISSSHFVKCHKVGGHHE